MEPEPAPEAERSSEERIQWLRDHGVTVEIPEDRKEKVGFTGGIALGMPSFTCHSSTHRILIAPLAGRRG